MWIKPLPNIDRDNRPMYEAFRDHQLALWRCTECGEWYFWKTYCRDHNNEPHFGDLELTEASGRGTVYAPLTSHYSFHPGFADETPYNYSLVELEEGPMMTSQVVGVPPSEVEIGMELEVTFEDVLESEIPEGESVPLEGGFTLPYFTPVEGSETA